MPVECIDFTVQTVAEHEEVTSYMIAHHYTTVYHRCSFPGGLQTMPRHTVNFTPFCLNLAPGGNVRGCQTHWIHNSSYLLSVSTPLMKDGNFRKEWITCKFGQQPGLVQHSGDNIRKEETRIITFVKAAGQGAHSGGLQYLSVRFKT